MSAKKFDWLTVRCDDALKQRVREKGGSAFVRKAIERELELEKSAAAETSPAPADAAPEVHHIDELGEDELRQENGAMKR